MPTSRGHRYWWHLAVIQDRRRIAAVCRIHGLHRSLCDPIHGLPGAMRGSAIGHADVILTVGRRLDFQLAYGSPAVFQSAKFVRISDTPTELRDNRRGAVEILASPAKTLQAMIEHAGNRPSEVDRQRAAKLRKGRKERARKLQRTMASAPAGSDGKLHPNKVLSALQEPLATMPFCSRWPMSVSSM